MNSVPVPFLCPKCNGQGRVSKPPEVAGDVFEWSSTATSFVCNVCHGAMILWSPLAAQLALKSEEGKESEGVRYGVVALQEEGDDWWLARNVDGVLRVWSGSEMEALQVCLQRNKEKDLAVQYVMKEIKI